MTFEELKKIAEGYVKPRQLSRFCNVAAVAAVLVTDQGNVYEGINIDTCCGMGFCAEHSAISRMLLNEETHIDKLVAVTNDGRVLPPCGRCREFMRWINEDNLDDTQIMVEDGVVKTLRELLPYPFSDTTGRSL